MIRKIFNIITSVVLVVLIAFVVLVFISRMNGKSPSIFGYHVFRVATESMEPTLEVGDVILVKSVPADEINVGDIVTYNGTVGDFSGKTITHRVIEGPEIIDGRYYYYTQGDKTGATKDPQIKYDQIEGKFIRKLPVLNALYSFFISPYGLIVFIFVIVTLFGYEIISLIISYKSADEKDEDYYAPPNRKKSTKRNKTRKAKQK